MQCIGRNKKNQYIIVRPRTGRPAITSAAAATSRARWPGPRRAASRGSCRTSSTSPRWRPRRRVSTVWRRCSTKPPSKKTRRTTTKAKSVLTSQLFRGARSCGFPRRVQAPSWAPSPRFFGGTLSTTGPPPDTCSCSSRPADTSTPGTSRSVGPCVVGPYIFGKFKYFFKFSNIFETGSREHKARQHANISLSPDLRFDWQGSNLV